MSLWKGDGVIARIENHRVANAVVASGCPAVDLSAARLMPRLPLIETDDRAIAALIANHFLECGLQQFAFLGDARYLWSQTRQRHYENLVREVGYNSSALNLKPTRHLDRQHTSIARWLARLPKPVGIITAYDKLAHRLLQACRAEGLGVPDEVAVASVDNEALLCQLTSPPLTSVTLDSRRMGYFAAELLDRMMCGEKVAPDVYLIEPIGLVPRQSSDILAVKDLLVARALRFIREHACDGIQVSDVVREIPASRRVLETRFSRLIRHSPHAEIVRVRMRRVRQLLRETELPLHLIADRTGFANPEYLSVAFKRETGTWPTEFRATARNLSSLKSPDVQYAHVAGHTGVGKPTHLQSMRRGASGGGN
jgi:LacI family transcriptional regulator